MSLGEKNAQKLIRNYSATRSSPFSTSLSFSSSHFLLLSCTHHQDASGNVTTFSLTSQGDWPSPAEQIRQPDGSTRRGKLFKLVKSADGSGTGHAGNHFYMYIFSPIICKTWCCAVLLCSLPDSEIQSLPTELCQQRAGGEQRLTGLNATINPFSSLVTGIEISGVSISGVQQGRDTTGTATFIGEQMCRECLSNHAAYQVIPPSMHS